MKFIYEYIWLGGNGNFRSKYRVINNNLEINEIPKWNYDGSSTNQAEGNDSEVILIPVKKVLNPLIESSYLVLCETTKPNGEPIFNNFRPNAKKIFDKYLNEKPWYGMEQEYFMINKANNLPLGFKDDGTSSPQGQYYCSVGTQNSFGRNIAEEHMLACIKAGLDISGINSEVAPGQWEFQIGPVEGIDAGDQMLIARYLLERIAEKHQVIINYHPKPLKGDWNGSGCHVNFSTQKMREGTVNNTGLNNVSVTGLEYIEEALNKLSKKHKEHMDVYGTDNQLRMTGKHETACYDKFSFGRANRGASVRIGNDTINDKKGYFEDRRPSSNMNPYQVTSIMLETIME